MPNTNPSPDHDPTVAVPPSSMLPVSLVPATRTGSDTLGVRSSDAPTIPERFGEFRILGELGRGGMGVVYRAEDPNLKREIAIKVMLPQYAANSDAKARFVREARAQAKVEHEHVAAIFQVAEHAGVPFLVMPLLKGMTLQAAIKANPRPPLTEVIRITREVAEGLAAAHEKGLVHRDIKPANIWLEGKKLRVRVLDFGLARAADVEATDTSEGPLTAEGAIVGTPAYMSPEQARGDAVDGRTDLFSLGVMLYQMSAGELPFRGGSALAVLSALALHVPPPLITKNPAVPPALSNLVERLLAKSAEGRPPTAETVAEELRAIELALTGAVRVIPLGDLPPIIVVDAVPSGPDPFADLDATEANSAPDAEPVEDAEPVSARMPMSATKPRSGFPVWATVGGVLLAVAGVVGFVVSQMGSKPVEAVKEEPPPPPKRDTPKKDKPVSADPERAAAVLLSPYFHLVLRLETPVRDVLVTPGQPLPSEPFKIIGIARHAASPTPPADIAAKVIPTILERGSLITFDDVNFEIRWSENDLTQLAKSPLRETLVKFQADFDPSPKAWEALKQFHFGGFGISGARVTDESVVGSPQLGEFQRFEVTDLGKSGKLTAKGWASLLNTRKIETLVLRDPQGLKPDVCMVLARIPSLQSIVITMNNADLDEDCYQELAKTPALRAVHLHGITAIPDAGWKHLAGIKTLAFLDIGGGKISQAGFDALAGATQLRDLRLSQTGVTEEQVKKFNAALTRCTIQWNKGTLEPSDPEFREGSRLLGRAGVVVRLPDGTDFEVQTHAAFPAVPFTVREIMKQGQDSFGNDDLKRLEPLSKLAKLQIIHHQITDAGLNPLLNLKNSLTELALDDGPVGDESLKVVGQLTGLTWLALGQTKVTDTGLAHLKGLAELRFLSLRDTVITDAGLNHLGGLVKLDHLWLTDTAVSDASIPTLIGMKGLGQLNLKGTRVTEVGLKKLKAAMPHCKIEWEEPNRYFAQWALAHGGMAIKVELTSGKEVQLTKQEGLPAGPFSVVEVQGGGDPIPFGDAEFRRLGTLTQLRSVGLGMFHKVTLDGFLAILASKNTLVHLHIYDGTVFLFTDDCAKWLVQLSRLETLSVTHPRITDAGCEHLARLENLRSLRFLEGVAISDVGVNHLAARKQLVTLDISKSFVTDIGLEHLAQMKSLRLLALSGTLVTDAGLKHVAQLKDLTELYLQDTLVSDAEIEQLTTLKSLSLLNLKSTRVTEAGFQKLKAALPKCNIMWSPRAVGLRFDNKSRVDFNDFKLDLRQPLTFEAYITVYAEEPPTNPQDRTCVYFDTRLHVGWSESKWHARIWNVTSVTHDGPVGKRTHIAGVFEENAVHLYVDGKLIGSKPIPTDAAYLKAQTDFHLGYWFPGVLEEVRVSKVARYEKDFTPAARFTTDKDTLALYHLDEGTPDEVKDSSGNGRHGKIIGAKWVFPDGAKSEPKKP